MLHSYFVIALRNLRKHLGYSVLNVVGLALGIACCLLMGLYVYDEVSHDRFHENADRIVRVVQTMDFGEGEIRSAMTSKRLGPTLTDAFPAVERSVRLDPESGVVRVGDRRFEEEIIFTDPSFFDVFSFPFEGGTRADLLQDPQSVVLSRAAATRFFGDNTPIGSTLSIRLGEAFSDFTVEGVLANTPSASSLQYDILLPLSKMDDLPSGGDQSWRGLSGPTYLLLSSADQIRPLAQALPAFMKETLPPNSMVRNYELQPLTDIYFANDIQSGLAATGNPAYVYLLSALALIVLLLACINFTTLALGRSVSRVREVGIRKVVGAVRSQLMKQFWGEALIVSCIALIGGLLLVEAVLPTYNDLTGKSLSVPMHPAWLFVFAGLLVAVSLLAGSYPAVYLSRFNPIAVLKGKAVGSGRHRLTHGLIVVQFAVSIFLVISTLFMSQQLDLLLQRNLGFDEDQVIRIRSNYGSTWEGRRLFDRFEERLSSETGVAGLTGSMYPFGQVEGLQMMYPLESDADTVSGHIMNVTPGFLETFGIELTRGRDFSDERPTDAAQSALVNEALVEAFGWDDPIGKRLSGMYGVSELTVIGVVPDFHYESLREIISPLILYIGDEPLWSLYARISPDNVPAAVAALERAWHAVAPDLPFEIEFVDQAVDRLYRSEMQWAWMIRTGAGIAIFIACLGLLGLAALAAARRRKEISIRQVLGASTEQIIVLLMGRFVGLVLIALAIATPLAYVAADRWLSDFAYRIDISPGVFLLAGAIAMAIAVLTVSTQAVRAALADPAEALRSE